MDTRYLMSPTSPRIKDSLPGGYVGQDCADESMTYDKEVKSAFQEQSPEIFETYSQKRRFIVDEDAQFNNMAATMRDPNVNKLNILDTLADYRNFKVKK